MTQSTATICLVLPRLLSCLDTHEALLKHVVGRDPVHLLPQPLGRLRHLALQGLPEVLHRTPNLSKPLGRGQLDLLVRTDASLGQQGPRGQLNVLFESKHATMSAVVHSTGLPQLSPSLPT